MRIFIGKWVVFVLLICFFCFPSVKHASEDITNGQIVPASSITPKDQLFIYTDGIVEASRASGDIFGFERLTAFMNTHAGHPANEFADAFIAHLSNGFAKRSEKALDDELTLIVVDYQYG